MASPSGNLQIGDRVRVSDNYYQECLQGVNGTIARPPMEVMTSGPKWNDFWRIGHQNSRVFWVVFDNMIRDDQNELIEASEVSEFDLEHVP